MNTNHTPPKHLPTKLPHRIALFGAIVGLLTLPSISGATTPLSLDEPQPIVADDDPPCEQAVIALEVDVSTGEVFLVDATGGLTLTDNDINVYFGTLTSVLIDIEYTSGEWDVDITPSGEATETHTTRGGSLRYWIYDDYDSYTFSSTESVEMSTMMNMTPVVPDIIIRPKKECPPST